MGFPTAIKKAYQHLIAGMAERRQKRRLQDQVLKDINTFIKKNCVRMSQVAGFQKRLAQSINFSLSHVSNLIDQIPGPIELDPKQWDDQPFINAVFLNEKDVVLLLKSSKELNRFFKNNNSPSAIALLTVKLTEKTVFTTEKTGEMVRRDVPQKAISFDDCRIQAPSQNIKESQFKIKHLALLALCRLTAQDTSDLQTWKKEIEAQQNLMEFKIHTAEPGEDLDETNQILSDLKRKIKTINQQLHVTEEHLDRITRIFDHPEMFLTLRPVSLKMDRMGIRLHSGSKERANEFAIAEFQFGQSPRMAACWVLIKKEFFS
jgi:hypothetical protein